MTWTVPFDVMAYNAASFAEIPSPVMVDAGPFSVIEVCVEVLAVSTMWSTLFPPPTYSLLPFCVLRLY